MSAGLWTAGAFATQRMFQLVSNLILTRLLFPEAFGLMALANVFMIGLAMFSDVGIRPAIVQNPRGEEEAFFQTAWTLQVIRGFSLWLAACLIAYPASRIYGQPILWPLISALGATSAIAGFSSVSMALCERKLMVKNLTILSTFSQITSICLTVMLTFYFNSIWSLVAGNVAGSILGMVFSHILLPKENHKFRLDRSSSDALVHFGRWIFISTAMTFLAGHGLRMLQGLLLTPTEFGVLAVATTISVIPGDLTQQIASRTVFPALSETRNLGHQKMINTMENIHGKLMVASITLFSLLIIFSIPIISLLYDSRYQSAGPNLAIMATGGAITVMSQPYQSAFLAMGETRLSATFNAISAVAKMLLMLIGHKLGGINGMLWGICGGALVTHAYVAHEAQQRKILSLRIDAACLTAIAGSYYAAYKFSDIISIKLKIAFSILISLIMHKP